MAPAQMRGAWGHRDYCRGMVEMTQMRARAASRGMSVVLKAFSIVRMPRSYGLGDGRAFGSVSHVVARVFPRKYVSPPTPFFSTPIPILPGPLVSEQPPTSRIANYIMEPKNPNGNQPSKKPRDKPRQEQKYHDDKHARSPAILQQPARSAKTSDAGATAGSGTDVARDVMSPPRRNAQDPQVAATFGSSLRDVTRFAGGAAANPLYGSPGRYGPSSLQSDPDALAHYLRKLPPR